MLPNWVKHRDGQVTAFDADAINQSLFAAAQLLGHADAFLVRELTDGVLHFLASEELGDTTTTEEIEDVVEKIVRELGQPALAKVYGERQPGAAPGAVTRFLSVEYWPGTTPEAIARNAVEKFTLRTVYSADIAAAHEQHVIHLHDLSWPRSLESLVLDPHGCEHDDPFEFGWNLALRNIDRAGGVFILDGAEWLMPEASEDEVREFVRGLSCQTTVRERSCELHLNVAEPPNWAKARGEGPLFQQTSTPVSPRVWLEACRQTEICLVWHWRGDASDEPFRDWLKAPANSYSVVFDRAGQPIALGRGHDRRSPGVMMSIGLCLDELLNRPDVSFQADTFLEKLPSLSRLAVSAGHQKRASLRRQAAHLSREFLLDRATVVLDLNLSGALRQLLGVEHPTTAVAQTFVRRVFEAIEGPLAEARERTGLNLVVASPNDEVPLSIVAELPRLEYWRDFTLTASAPPSPSLLDSLKQSSDVTRLTF